MQKRGTEQVSEQCSCGHLLRSERERTDGQCIECRIAQNLLPSTSCKGELSMIPTSEEEHNAPLTWHDLTQLKTLWIGEHEHASTNVLKVVGHMALRAIHSEEEAQTRSSISADAPSFTVAYRYCEVLDVLKQAVENWVYVAARLWYIKERETGASESERDHLDQLHQCSIAQQQRLFLSYFLLQSRLQDFCHQHHILLSAHVIDQALDLSVEETAHAR